MIDVLTNVSLFADYRVISALTQVCRQLNQSHLWTNAIDIRYPHMIGKCEHLPDYLRFLIAKCSGYLGFSYKGRGYVFEKTKQILNSPLSLSAINPEELGRYYILKRYHIIDSGDKEYVINYFERIHKHLREKYVIYDSLHMVYSFADITIEIYDEDYDESKFTYDDFLICRS